MLLVTGSWCVARAVAAIKRDAARPSARWLALAIASGIAFVVVKGLRIPVPNSALGIDLDTNLFYTCSIFR